MIFTNITPPYRNGVAEFVRTSDVPYRLWPSKGGPFLFSGPAYSQPIFVKVYISAQICRRNVGEEEAQRLSLSGVLAIRILKLLQKEQRYFLPEMAGLAGFHALAPKTKNLVVAGGLTAFVFGVYFYTMRAVGGTDELQIAIDKFEELKHKDQK